MARRADPAATLNHQGPMRHDELDQSTRLFSNTVLQIHMSWWSLSGPRGFVHTAASDKAGT